MHRLSRRADRPRDDDAVWVSLALGLLLAACSPYQPVREPLPPTLAFAEHWSAGGEVAAEANDAPEAARETDGDRAGRRWWEALGDAQLSEAVGTAVRENFQVRAAWARVRQADTLGMQAGAAWWPQVSAQLDVGYRRSVLVLGEPLGTRVIENPSYGISLPVSYEIDVWDRIGSQTRGAAADAVAARDEVEALAMTVAANVVEAWLNVVYQRELRATIEAQLATSADYLALVEARFAEGLGTAPDVFQQRAQLEGLRSQLATTIAQEGVAEAQLAVLLGRMPGGRNVPDDRRALPEPLALPPLGVPGDLLLRRPDVRAARQRVAAADQRVAAAVADRFPRFNLGGSVGFSTPDLATFFESFVFNLLGSIVAPLFDGERREAVVQQNHAIVWERTELLAQSMVVAAQEVESALVQEREQRAQLRVLEDRLESARAALESSRERYASGLLEGYLQVLTALATEQQARQALLQARRQLLSFRVQLHRALGGDWTADLERPDPRRPVSASSPSGEPNAAPESPPNASPAPPSASPTRE
jgi:NodT family efflux transporter outer membrane factor (OMF) lipoprotein